MTRMIKLTHFENETTWDKSDPTNKEKLTDCWINPDKVVAVMTSSYYIPSKDSGANEHVPKTIVIFEGSDCYYYVNESVEDVVSLLGQVD